MPGTFNIDIDEGCPICKSEKLTVEIAPLEKEEDCEGFAKAECGHCGHKWEAAYSFKKEEDV